MATTSVLCCKVTCYSDKAIRHATEDLEDPDGPGVLVALAGRGDAVGSACPQDGETSADRRPRTGDPNKGPRATGALSRQRARAGSAHRGSRSSGCAERRR